MAVASISKFLYVTKNAGELLKKQKEIDNEQLSSWISDIYLKLIGLGEIVESQENTIKNLQIELAKLKK